MSHPTKDEIECVLYLATKSGWVLGKYETFIDASINFFSHAKPHEWIPSCPNFDCQPCGFRTKRKCVYCKHWHNGTCRIVCKDQDKWEHW